MGFGVRVVFKVAFVGAGYMAREYISAVTNRDTFEAVGIVGRSTERALGLSSEFGGIPTFTSIEALYETTEADLVVIAVSELETQGVLNKIWQFPWTCLVEKPAGYNLEAARAVLQDSINAPGATFLALNRRHYESMVGAKAILAKQGGPRILELVDQHDTIEALRIGTPNEVVRNWHFANAIHTVDLLRHFTRGAITSVKSEVWRDGGAGFVVNAGISFSSGDYATYASYWNIPNNWSFSVATPNERVLMRPLERLFRQITGQRNLEELSLSGRDTIFKPGLSSMLDDLEAFLRGESHNLTSLSDGYETMSLLDEIFRDSPLYRQ
jgi:predicted dehydrogenase